MKNKILIVPRDIERKLNETKSGRDNYSVALSNDTISGRPSSDGKPSSGGKKSGAIVDDDTGCS